MSYSAKPALWRLRNKKRWGAEGEFNVFVDWAVELEQRSRIVLLFWRTRKILGYTKISPSSAFGFCLRQMLGKMLEKCLTNAVKKTKNKIRKRIRMYTTYSSSLMWEEAPLHTTFFVHPYYKSFFFLPEGWIGKWSTYVRLHKKKSKALKRSRERSL